MTSKKKNWFLAHSSHAKGDNDNDIPPDAPAAYTGQFDKLFDMIATTCNERTTYKNSQTYMYDGSHL